MTSAHPCALAASLLSRGQDDEARGKFADALLSYSEAIAALEGLPWTELDTRRQLGVAWMNRGNVLQKQREVSAAVAAYDEAIALFAQLPISSAQQNHLGAAWLNRGHAFLEGHDPSPDPEAARSFKRAIDFLRDLPLEENSAYRLNLAGAWTNLAHVQLPVCAAEARLAARAALDLVTVPARDHLSFAEMSLRGRRAQIIALGELLRAAETAGESIDILADEAADSIDAGLALAREYEERGNRRLRPLAARLFRVGLQLYRIHQPHFLVEFIFENIDSSKRDPAGLGDDPEWVTAAKQAVAKALEEGERPRLLFADSPASLRFVQTAQELRRAQRRLAEVFA